MLTGITPDHVSAAGDLATGFAAMFAAWQGFKSLSAWRVQLVERRRIEVAEEALERFYEMESALAVIRSPFAFATEWEGRPTTSGENQTGKRLRDFGWQTFKRSERFEHKIAPYRSTCTRIKVVFGNQLHEEFYLLLDCLHQINVSADMLLNCPDAGYDDFDFAEKLRMDVMYSGSRAEKDPDSIESKIKKARTVVEAELTKVIQQR
jgi:hypothetical protein